MTQRFHSYVCAQRIENRNSNMYTMGNLVVQWLGLQASTAGGMSSIPGQGTKILQATRCGQKN